MLRQFDDERRRLCAEGQLIEQLPRVTRLQEMSRANKLRFHMRDGPGQEARDAEWARAGDRTPDALRWLYEHDPSLVEAAPA